jgi:hypothetical protein
MSLALSRRAVMQAIPNPCAYPLDITPAELAAAGLGTWTIDNACGTRVTGVIPASATVVSNPPIVQAAAGLLANAAPPCIPAAKPLAIGFHADFAALTSDQAQTVVFGLLYLGDGAGPLSGAYPCGIVVLSWTGDGSIAATWYCGAASGTLSGATGPSVDLVLWWDDGHAYLNQGELGATLDMGVYPTAHAPTPVLEGAFTSAPTVSGSVSMQMMTAATDISGMYLPRGCVALDGQVIEPITRVPWWFPATGDYRWPTGAGNEDEYQTTLQANFAAGAGSDTLITAVPQSEDSIDPATLPAGTHIQGSLIPRSGSDIIGFEVDVFGAGGTLQVGMRGSKIVLTDAANFEEWQLDARVYLNLATRAGASSMPLVASHMVTTDGSADILASGGLAALPYDDLAGVGHIGVYYNQATGLFGITDDVHGDWGYLTSNLTGDYASDTTATVLDGDVTGLTPYVQLNAYPSSETHAFVVPITERAADFACTFPTGTLGIGELTDH